VHPNQQLLEVDPLRLVNLPPPQLERLPLPRLAKLEEPLRRSPQQLEETEGKLAKGRTSSLSTRKRMEKMLPCLRSTKEVKMVSSELQRQADGWIRKGRRSESSKHENEVLADVDLPFRSFRSTLTSTGSTIRPSSLDRSVASPSSRIWFFFLLESRVNVRQSSSSSSPSSLSACRLLLFHPIQCHRRSSQVSHRYPPYSGSVLASLNPTRFPLLLLLDAVGPTSSSWIVADEGGTRGATKGDARRRMG